MIINDKFFDLVSRAIYPPTNPDFLINYAAIEEWKSDPKKACHNAISSCPRIDWRAYLANNPDVKEAGIDPAKHFLSDGIFEARRLYVKRQTEVCDTGKYPFKISIIMPNFDDAEYLDDCFQSLVNQTLENIEIIAVDDGSTDNSLEIMEKWANKDPRIKVLKNQKNMSQHIARKRGVNIAQGEFIMMIDSDDQYVHEACQIAYDEAIKGYDVVSFEGTVLEDASGIEGRNIADVEKFMKSAYFGVLTGPEIMREFVQTKCVSRYINTKIYHAEMLKEAFSEMTDGYFPRGQDEYELFMIARHARSLLSVNYNIYLRRPFCGVSTPGSIKSKIEQYMAVGDQAKVFKDFVDKYGGHNNFRKQYEYCIQNQIKYWLSYVDETSIDQFFKCMLNQYGILPVLDMLIDQFKNKWSYVASRYKFVKKQYLTQRKKIKNICLLYGSIGEGGADKIIVDFCNNIINENTLVNLLLCRSTQNVSKLDERITINYLQEFRNNSSDLKQHIHQLHDILVQNKPDLIIIHNFQGEQLLWQTILAQSLNIPIVIYQHVAFYHRLLFGKTDFNQRQLNASLECADKVLCLSKDAELYYRNIGINAECIINPVNPSKVINSSFDFRKDCIIYVSRLGSPLKRVGDALRIMYEIVKIKPYMRMIFVGSFGNAEYENNFYKTVEKYKLGKNIFVTGWIQDPGIYLNKALLLLSTSYTESFSLAIAEAQAHGLPCVAYELPITQTENNESIIQVQQGDFLQAAVEILKLIDDEKRWSYLSKIAKIQASEYSMERYKNCILKILDDFLIKSNVRYYTEYDYEKVIRILTFYKGQTAPN